ncbi:hypothetical protein BB559_006884 [Furculomyces boomerangus]|uniref:RING-type domain-containing protein n=1 Tax=Furculomyces boomerangus TaxID=61424 RepID=A0A2T9Y009_9FUNG|nr:hypothetical protein BB559_006884 [Furculomyces boomerangus]
MLELLTDLAKELPLALTLVVITVAVLVFGFLVMIAWSISKRNALSKKKTETITDPMNTNQKENPTEYFDHTILPVKNIFPTANFISINPDKQKKVVLSKDLESYPVVTMKVYKKSTAHKIPEKVFEKKKLFSPKPRPHEPKTSTNSKVECSICFVELKDEDLVRIIPCYHPFHKHCIDNWLLERLGFCPTCNLDLRKTPESGINYQNLINNTNQQPSQNHTLNDTANQNANINTHNHWVGNSDINQTYKRNQVIDQSQSTYTATNEKLKKNTN